jgi:fructosamine-3-kinase
VINWNAIAAAINQATGVRFEIASTTPQSGGCINQCFRIGNKAGQYFFVKLNTPSKHVIPSAGLKTMFAAEARGLNELAATNTIRVPHPITYGVSDTHSFLVLEYLELNGPANMAMLGTQLAQLHRIHATQFGWHQGNTIGDSPQLNNWSDNWVAFWCGQRLGFQLELAVRNGLTGKLQQHGERLMARLDEFFVGYQPMPSLLHGDLWGGNHGFTTNGLPVLFDPAPYFGDRETDLAMTRLFGGFSPDFYTAYHTAYPLNSGYELRRDLYNLYHILNHANLFGGNYAQQATQIMQSLLKKIS